MYVYIYAVDVGWAEPFRNARTCSHVEQITDPHYSSWPRSARQDRYIPDLYDLYDLYDLAHVAGWDPHNLHDLAHVSWVLNLYYTDPAQHIINNDRLGSRLS